MKIQLTTMVLGVCLLAGCGMFKGGSKPEAQLPAGTGTAATAQPPWGGNPQQPPKRGIPPAAHSLGDPVQVPDEPLHATGEFAHRRYVAQVRPLLNLFGRQPGHPLGHVIVVHAEDKGLAALG